MSQTKTERITKRQLGQFMTPPVLAARLVQDMAWTPDDAVLEPSFGNGSFILPLIEAFLPFYEGSIDKRLASVLTRNVYGIEYDSALYSECLQAIQKRWGELPARHNLVCGDFFRHWFYDEQFMPANIPANQVREGSGGLFDVYQHFDVIVGNPPFGGTIDPALQDQLDKQFGLRGGEKIKKETYSFFIVKCLDLLKPQGRLRFICSDTFLTINTMRGLRLFVMGQGKPSIMSLRGFSDETKYPMVVLDIMKSPSEFLSVNGADIAYSTIHKTGNASWQVTDDLAGYFDGPKIGDYLVATSGMTTGANELFVRPIVNGRIKEPYTFEFYEDPITLRREQERARLGIISPRKQQEILQAEQEGRTRRNVRVAARAEPVEIILPHPDYRFYNKAAKGLVYAPPSHVIYWKDDGDAVLTFKKNGNWYLHGVGGMPYFGRSGLTWPLIATSLNARFLSEGSILDSGAPCAFLRPGVGEDELYFILAWTFSPLCQRLLKEVVNHTKNIQGKDVERLPYPFWVEATHKTDIICRVRTLVADAMQGRIVTKADTDFRAVAESFTSKI